MVLTSLILAASLAGAAEFDLQTLDGRSAVGQVVGLDARQLTVQSAEGRSNFTLGTLAVVVRRDPPASHRKANVVIELMDQSLLLATQYLARGETAEVTLLTGAVEVPTRAIRWVRFSRPDDRDPLAKQWSDAIAAKAAGDLLVVRKNGALDYLEGVQGDIDADTCAFELEKEQIPVPRAKVEGVVYYHAAAAEMSEPIGHLLTIDGARLAMRTVELSAADVKLVTPAGASLSVPLDDVARFDFSSGKIAFLSDLEPESASNVPYFGFADEPEALRDFYRFRRDVSFDQNPLRLDGKSYRKGLAIASRTVLVYRLPGKFRLFKTTLGIDDSVREVGSVRVEIKGDGKRLWQSDVRGVEPARELELDVVGIKRLEITVDYGDDLDIGDRLDLCDARVTK